MILAIGEEQLGNELGETYECPRCGEKHQITYGKKKLEDGTWVETKMLSFYKCGERTYLAGIDGRKIRGKNETA